MERAGTRAHGTLLPPYPGGLRVSCFQVKMFVVGLRSSFGQLGLSYFAVYGSFAHFYPM